jgi:hypothetical protein
MSSRSLSLAVAAAVSVAACPGCGNSGGLYPVTGKVLYKGEPAAGAVVYFHRQGATDPLHEQTPQGVVREDGIFALAGPAGEGALPGEYAVLVEWKEGAGKVRGRSPGLSAPDRFRGRYLDASKPLLHAEVKPSTNTLPPFELK